MNSLATNIITLTCPSCGAKLKLVDGIHLLVCASCGNEHMVHHNGGAIYLAPIAQDVRQIRAGVDKTAAELAVVRLTKELQVIIEEVEEAKKRNYTNDVKPGVVLSVLPVAMLASVALVGIGANAESVGLAATMMCVLVGEVILYGILHGNRTRAGYQLRDEELGRLQDAYNTKRAALNKNHQIANS